jgi:hypothetical protein
LPSASNLTLITAASGRASSSADSSASVGDDAGAFFTASGELPAQPASCIKNAIDINNFNEIFKVNSFIINVYKTIFNGSITP